MSNRKSARATRARKPAAPVFVATAPCLPTDMPLIDLAMRPEGASRADVFAAVRLVRNNPNADITPVAMYRGIAKRHKLTLTLTPRTADNPRIAYLLRA